MITTMVRFGGYFIILLAGSLVLRAYTFTDTKGREFEGTVLAVNEAEVTVRRSVDGLRFELAQSVFSETDQAYFKRWEATESLQYRLRKGETIRALPRQLRIDLIWERGDLPHYEVQRSEDGGNTWTTLPNKTPELHVFSDFIGDPNVRRHYRVRNVRFSRSGGVTEIRAWSEVVQAQTRRFDVDALLGEVQEAAVRFYFEEAHPVSGLSPEGQPGWGNVCAVGSTGMGMANIIVGVERGIVSREDGLQLALQMLRFLDQTAPKPRGALGHWMDGKTGEIKNFGEPKDAVDLVETAFLIQGAILLREYFDHPNPQELELRQTVNRLSADVQWDFFMQEDHIGPYMKWHWHPQDGFWKMGVRGFNETMMCYILGIGSATHPIPVKSFFSGWMRGGRNFSHKQTHFGVTHDLGGGIGWPLFFAHYSHLGFDPNAVSHNGKTYFEHFTDATRVHRLYAQSRAEDFEGYGPLWGLAASLNPDGYFASHPGQKDNGTIATTAALSSIPYLPEEVKGCMQVMYLDYGKELWGGYGFYNAINPSRDWLGARYIGIELGPIAPMIENYRSGLLWKLFMQSPEAQRAMKRLRENATTTVYFP